MWQGGARDALSIFTKLNPMFKLLRIFADKVRGRIGKAPFRSYIVTYHITFDNDLVNSFEVIITARSQGHAWQQVKAHMKVKPVTIKPKR